MMNSPKTLIVRIDVAKDRPHAFLSTAAGRTLVPYPLEREWMSGTMSGFCRNSCRDTVAIPLQPLDFQSVTNGSCRSLSLQQPLLKKGFEVAL